MTALTGGELIFEARRRAGLTQAELARRLGSHQSVVARWESGSTSPSFASVRKAVRAAGFDLGTTLSPSDDHDDALITRELGLLPHERLARLVSAVRALDAMTAVARG